jgi:hypothetical protein
LESGLSHIEPIPLTEEWLLKLGLNKIAIWTFSLHLVGNLELIYYSGEKGWSIGLKNYSDFSNLKYVHQLQNLYFALTRKELTIKLLQMQNKEQKDELSTSAQMAQNHLLCDVNDEDDFKYEESTPPDYYVCMCCGNVQSHSYSCNKCAGPMSECWY